MPSAAILFFFVLLDYMVFAVAITSERRLANGGPLLLLLKRRGDAVQPPTLEGGIKEAAAMAVEPEVAEIPPMPLPQIMLPRNMTADALKPPLGAAQVAPPPRRLVDVDVCRGYYDVMGQFDITFNCTKGTYIYCCGTCHYRFCCEHQRNRLDQDSCTNYKSPIWANTQVPATQPPSRSDPDFDPLQQQSNNTAYVIGGVISFTLAVAIGVRVAFHKISRRPRNRDINMPRALVDILRHQSSPVQQGERNNSTVLTSTTGERTLAQQSKNLYMPILQSKDNRIGKHNLIQSGSSPKHTATIERVPRMNNAQLVSTGTLLSSKNINASPHPTLSHSFHNLAQLPPSYEAVMKPEINRYCSLKRLEKELDDYTGYYTSKRRPNNTSPSFHSSQHHLHWGGDYTVGSRGTLPLNSSRPRIHAPISTSTPNPYPLPQSPYNHTFETTSKPPRRVMSQDHLLALGEGNTLSYLSKNQQHQYYKAIATSMNTNSQTHRKSHERLLVSPDRLEERMIGGGMGDYGLGIMSTMSHLNHHKKAQSQQNVCVTPSLDRHHMIKMNSNPSSGREQERSVVAMSAGHGASAPSWGEGHSSGGGAGTMGHSARRMAFATKRQNTIEQLHFLPGGGGGGGGVGSQALRTGSKNEVTV
ncbi:protein shisa-7 [Electrophorus electricus]|uniref:protein shisa-7 n=1 Tax=Electrophorus electricus TaxID=8005 RepID=UPI0015CFB2DE|nr:protein shisa-7 [Electrophorus electricus]XP_035385105.1 protein shisa-7 [Electrophorus electricus]